MDLGKLFERFEQLDAAETATAVGFLVEHRATLAKVVDFLQDWSDDAMRIARNLPELVTDLGEGLQAAGAQARDVAVNLVGDDGEGGAFHALTGGAAAVDACRDKLADVGTLLNGVADALDDITIPSIETKHAKVAGLRVLSGIDITKDPLLSGPARLLRDSAGDVEGVAGQLHELVEHLGGLADVLTRAGGALSGLGDRLDDAGSGVRRFAGSG